MSDSTTTKAKPAGTNTAAAGGDHDRVAMLSLKADGTPDQLNPELIGPKADAEKATATQFAEQAVSAADVEIRGVTAGEPGPATDDASGYSTTEDPTVADIQAAHEAAAKPAEANAAKVVSALHKGVGDPA